MKRATKIAITVATAISLGLAAAAVSARPSGYGPAWGGHMGGYGQGYGMGAGLMGGYGPGQGMGPQAMYDTSSGNADEGLAALKAELGITAKQDAAWQAFAKSARQQAELETQAAALKDLYAALTPEQKAIADQRLGGFGPGYGAGYGRGYGDPGGRLR